MANGIAHALKYKVNPGFAFGLLSLIAIMLAGFKFAGHLSWSWWLVLAPLWVPWLLLGVILLIFIALAAVCPKSGSDIR